MVMFNRHSIGTQYPNHKITVDFRWLGYDADASMVVRDLFARKDLGSFRGSFTGEQLMSPAQQLQSVSAIRLCIGMRSARECALMHSEREFI